MIRTLVMALAIGACSSGAAGEDTSTASRSPAASAGATDGQEPSTSDEPIRIGASVALTGPVAPEGLLVQRGYEYWAEQVNAKGGIDVGGQMRPVELVFYDDESDAETSTRLTERLITEDEVDFLLSPYSSGITQATTTIAERYNVLTIASNANGNTIYERGYRNVFSVLPPASSYLSGTVDLLADLEDGPETAAVLIRDDPFGIAAGEGALAALEDNGIEIVYESRYVADATDLSSILTSVKSADPDVIVASTLFTDVLLITRQSKDLQLMPDAFVFSAGVTLPGVPEELGSDAEYLLGANWWDPGVSYEGEDTIGSSQDFVTGIEAAHGETPDYTVAAATMAGLVLEKAIEAAASTDTDAVREALLGLELESFWGPIGWDETGTNIVGSSVPVQIVDGAVTQIDPELITYPVPAWGER